MMYLRQPLNRRASKNVICLHAEVPVLYRKAKQLRRCRCREHSEAPPQADEVDVKSSAATNSGAKANHEAELDADQVVIPEADPTMNVLYRAYGPYMHSS
jgi:hypothetical protein